MFHTVAYNKITASTGALTTFSLNPIADSLCASSGTGFLMPYDMKVIGGFVGGGCVVRARLTAPSLYRVALPYIVPVSATSPTPAGAPTPGSTAAVASTLASLPLSNPNYFINTSNPTGVRASEPLGVDVMSIVAASSESGTAVVWLADKIDPIPAGDAFWLRYTSTTAAVGFQWTSLAAFSWDQTPAPGTYAVIGMSHFSQYGVAARINFPGQVFRPGVLSLNDPNNGDNYPGSSRTHAAFYEGTLGLYGTFQTFAPPIIEVLTTGACAAHEGFLRCVRIGDIGSMSTGGR